MATIKIERKKNEDVKGKFMKQIIKWVIIMNVAYTVAVFYVFLKTGSEPATLTERWFKFTSGELSILGIVKVVKLFIDWKKGKTLPPVIENLISKEEEE